jgi:hypothetical protein
MLFGDVMAIGLSIAGFLLSLQGLWLVCLAMWPRRVARTAERCERNGIKSFLVGVLVTGGFLLASVVVAKRLGTAGQLAAWALGFLFLIFSGIGTTGLVTHLGKRLSSPADADRPWKATVRGGVALELAYLVPILGWFGLLPLSLIIGAGAATLSFIGRREAATPPYATAGRQWQDRAYADASLYPPAQPSIYPPAPASPPPLRPAPPELEPAGVGR